MQSTLRSASLILFVLAIISCGGDRAEVSDRHSDDHAAHDTAATEGIEELQLNDGAKWKMDDHTRLVFSEMAQSFLGSDPLSQNSETLKQVGAELQMDLNRLIRGCTMTGPAHDQLHKFLTGYMPAVASLAGTGQLEDAKRVKHYLEMYDKYFE